MELSKNKICSKDISWDVISILCKRNYLCFSAAIVFSEQEVVAFFNIKSLRFEDIFNFFNLAFSQFLINWENTTLISIAEHKDPEAFIVRDISNCTWEFTFHAIFHVNHERFLRRLGKIGFIFINSILDESKIDFILIISRHFISHALRVNIVATNNGRLPPGTDQISGFEIFQTVELVKLTAHFRVELEFSVIDANV